MTQVPSGPPPPQISVIVTAHGRREFLLDAVRSVADPALVPGTVEICVIKNFEDAPIDRELDRLGAVHYETGEDPLGAKVALGIDRSRGRIIAFLEDDDAYEPGRLARLLELFRADPSLGYYRNGQRKIGHDGRSLRDAEVGRAESNLARFGKVAGAPTELDAIAGRLARIDPDFNLSSIAVRRDVVAGRTPEMRSYTAAVDSFVFYAALEARAGVWIESRPLTRYRVHSSNASLWQGDSEVERLARAQYQRRFLDCFANIYGTTERTGPRAAAALAGSAYYGTWIVYRVLTGEGGRRALASDLWRFWRKSPFGALRHRYDLSAWALAGVLAPASARRAFVRRRNREAGGVATAAPS